MSFSDQRSIQKLIENGKSTEIIESRSLKNQLVLSQLSTTKNSFSYGTKPGQHAKKTSILERFSKTDKPSIEGPKIRNHGLRRIAELSFKLIYGRKEKGGILCVWDPNSFVKDNATISDYFVAVRGTWLSTATKVIMQSFYADVHEVRSKQGKVGRFLMKRPPMSLITSSSSAGLIDLHMKDIHLLGYQIGQGK
ncbi:hypothetical protein Tco_1329735 [Tanacetum coccineum]